MNYDNSKMYHSLLNKIMPVALVAGTTLACSPSSPDINNYFTNSPVPSTPDNVNLDGGIQKGPFIQGSDIQLYLLDDSGNNLGSVYNTQTTDNVGNFSTTLAGLSADYTGNLSVSSNGFYFKEYAGTLSNAQQTLKALYDADSNSTIYVNLVTHVSYQRAAKLLRDNADLSASVSQAQDELITALAPIGLIYPTSEISVGTDMNLFGDNVPGNQYLLALSCVFENAVKSSDSGLQDLLNAY